MSKHPGVLVAMILIFYFKFRKAFTGSETHLEITSAQTKLTTGGMENSCSPLTPDAHSREASTVVQTFRDTGIGL